MGKLKDIFSSGAEKLVGTIGDAIDKNVTNEEEKLSLKERISELVISAVLSMYQTRANIVIKEMDGNWLQRSWRPIIMLTCGAILVCMSFGWGTSSMSENLKIEVLGLLKMGIGGFIAGRSLEKITDKVTRNMDVSMLRKKERADKFEL
jgi:hypothetical protein